MPIKFGKRVERNNNLLPQFLKLFVKQNVYLTPNNFDTMRANGNKNKLMNYNNAIVNTSADDFDWHIKRIHDN